MSHCHDEHTTKDNHNVVIKNMKHRHAFVLVGEQQLFGVHMTQYHCELHKYQIIIKIDIGPHLDEFQALRNNNPEASLFLLNSEAALGDDLNREFSVPELASEVESFRGDIYFGLPPFTPKEAEEPHFIPWTKDRCIPAISNIHVTVQRVVYFRPFDHLFATPTFALYFLFGSAKHKEAHLTNIQTAPVATSQFEPPAFGPGYDHVMSLKHAPNWIEDAMLNAGIVVSLPQIPLIDANNSITIPCEKVFNFNDKIVMMYRGMQPELKARAGETFLQCTAVCNGPETSMSYSKVAPCCEEQSCYITPMPKRYLNLKDKIREKSKEL